jgi:hypothetical protein
MILDRQIRLILENPNIGDEKKGDLGEVYDSFKEDESIA